MNYQPVIVAALALTALMSACAASGTDLVRLQPMEEPAAEDLSPQARLQGLWLVHGQAGQGDVAPFLLEVEGTTLRGQPFDSSETPLRATFTGTDGEVMKFKADDGSMVYARFTSTDTAIAWTPTGDALMKVFRAVSAPVELQGQYTACALHATKTATIAFGADTMTVMENGRPQKADITWVAAAESTYKIVMKPEDSNRVFILNVLKVNDTMILWAEKDDDDIVAAFRGGSAPKWVGCAENTSVKDINRNTSAP